MEKPPDIIGNDHDSDSTDADDLPSEGVFPIIDITLKNNYTLPDITDINPHSSEHNMCSEIDQKNDDPKEICDQTDFGQVDDKEEPKTKYQECISNQHNSENNKCFERDQKRDDSSKDFFDNSDFEQARDEIESRDELLDCFESFMVCREILSNNIVEDLSERQRYGGYIDCFESSIICLDILAGIVDDALGIDFSSGSSDDYVPDSNESEDSTVKQRKKSKNRRQVLVRYISDSDISEDVTNEEIDQPKSAKHFWEREGFKNGKKKKVRKSLKERREDRERRQLLKNTGKAFITKGGKQVPEKTQAVLEPCKRFKCSDKIPARFRKNVFDFYWKLGTYDKRRRFIGSCIDKRTKKSARLEIVGNRQREFSNKYILKLNNEQYTTCKSCFLKILNESPKFVQTVSESMKTSNVIGTSKRGKQPSYKAVSEDKLEEAKLHILSLPAYESHYGRTKTTKKFLPSHLNITLMHEDYVSKTPDPISKTIYSSIFKAQNLSFKQPKVDTCLKCDTLNAEMQLAFGEEQQRLKTDLSKHQKVAEEVYDSKTDDKLIASEVRDDMMVLTFDLQQCLPTPLLTTGAAFYKRQLWTFNLTIHNCVTNEAVCLMWHEGEAARGGNEIASCVYYYLTHLVPQNIKHVVLYSDSCSGQNKNKFMITMFLLAVKNTHIETIQHKYFVPGHTHMECDADHALIEKEKKKTKLKIHIPRDWYQLVRNVSKKGKITVQEMKQEHFLDFLFILKGPLVSRSINEDKEKFLISSARVFNYSKESFPTFTYKTDNSPELLKTVDYARKGRRAGRQAHDFSTVPLLYSGPNPISNEKKRDLLSLFPLIDPEARAFYTNLQTSNDALNIDPDLENFEEE